MPINAAAIRYYLAEMRAAIPMCPALPQHMLTYACLHIEEALDDGGIVPEDDQCAVPANGEHEPGTQSAETAQAPEGPATAERAPMAGDPDGLGLWGM